MTNENILQETAQNGQGKNQTQDILQNTSNAQDILPLQDEFQDDLDVAPNTDASDFASLGLNAQTLQAIKQKGFTTPTPIQTLAIPRLLFGDNNLVVKARTGTGKTAAFGLPIVQQLQQKQQGVKALILEPTRELAVQTQKEMSSFALDKYPKSVVVYGGASMGEQIRQLKKGTQIVVGTPGRVQDHIERKTLDISAIDYFILDEADEMLDMGFIEDIENIFKSANPKARILLFSATMPAPILKIAKKFMGDYEVIKEEVKEEAPLQIDQQYWILRQSQKIEALVRLVDITPDFYGLVFTRTKQDADAVAKMLDERGYQVATLHGDIAQAQREKVLSRFRIGKTRILVATDVAARGIDIQGLSHVVNYDIPQDAQTYTHRIGRTGRAGAVGRALTFVCPKERKKIEHLVQASKKAHNSPLVQGKIPTVEQVLSSKTERMFCDMKQKLLDQEETKDIFTSMAQELCSGKDATQVLANVLALTYGKTLDKSHYGDIDIPAQNENKNGKRDKKGSAHKNFVAQDKIRIYVQYGRKDGATPRQIADYFAKLLSIPQRLVDDIGIRENFCLVTLPKDAGTKAILMSQKDKSLPAMHQDTKSSDDFESQRYFTSSKRQRQKPQKESFLKEGFQKENHKYSRQHTKGDFSFSGFDKKPKKSRHTQTQRNASSSYKKVDHSQEY